MAGEMTESDIVSAHIEKICAEARLGVMAQVYEILLDRIDINVTWPDPAVGMLALSSDDVVKHYEHWIAPAIDTMEGEIL